MTELHCVIAGRVQGVGYRAFVQSIARELGVTGYVANLPNGSVEVRAQGEYGVLKVLSNHLITGSSSAQVTGYNEEWQNEPTKVFASFETV
jgi:acylphosphatase